MGKRVGQGLDHRFVFFGRNAGQTMPTLLNRALNNCEPVVDTSPLKLGGSYAPIANETRRPKVEGKDVQNG